MPLHFDSYDNCLERLYIQILYLNNRSVFFKYITAACHARTPSRCKSENDKRNVVKKAAISISSAAESAAIFVPISTLLK
mmetsp:Transcript_11159/g.26538  ORF Transcript_11159/g.26538 Transcript_11159/m.26538 type:complete len:80 (+) Transcript_11159:142-381(+)